MRPLPAQSFFGFFFLPAWMGDFSLIRQPSKYAARMGQVFSSTVGTVILEDVQVGEKDDVWDSEGKYCFSDGVGVMSSALAKCVAKKLRLDHVPSAFQVRYAGAKGKRRLKQKCRCLASFTRFFCTAVRLMSASLAFFSVAQEC